MFLGLLAVAAVFGILAAWRGGVASFYQPRSQTTNEQRELIITDIVVGAVRDPATAGSSPALTQKSEYYNNESIGLKITRATHYSSAIQISARLLTKNGQLVTMNPSILSFKPGQDTFCCWIIEQPDDYSLQLFRPEGITTTIPLKINDSPATGQRSINIF